VDGRSSVAVERSAVVVGGLRILVVGEGVESDLALLDRAGIHWIAVVGSLVVVDSFVVGCWIGGLGNVGMIVRSMVRCVEVVVVVGDHILVVGLGGFGTEGLGWARYLIECTLAGTGGRLDSLVEDAWVTLSEAFLIDQLGFSHGPE
jgi:hypothetical protein